MIFDRLEKREITTETEWTSWAKGDDFITENSLKDQNYLTALNILGNSIAKLPILVKQTTNSGEIEAKGHYLWDLLRNRPNDNMNTFECIKSLIMMYKHYGQAGLYADRNNKGKVKALYPVRIDQFTIDNVGLIKSTKQNKVLVDFTCVDKQGSCFDSDIIILRDNSIGGINCKPTRNYIKDIIDTNLKAQAYQSDLFSNGMTNKAVVQMTSDIKDVKELKKVQEKFNRLYSSKGRIFTVPAGFSITLLNLSLADSQFSELKIIGKKDVASAVGIPYSLLENGTMTDEENISYLSNTIQPILTQLEQEFDYKVLGIDRNKGYKIRFNVSVMLRVSPSVQKDILIGFVQNGVYTINDARAILGFPSIEGGDTITLPSGQVTLENLINGTATWQKDTNITVEGGE